QIAQDKLNKNKKIQSELKEKVNKLKEKIQKNQNEILTKNFQHNTLKNDLEKIEFENANNEKKRIREIQIYENILKKYELVKELETKYNSYEKAFDLFQKNDLVKVQEEKKMLMQK